MRRPLQVRLLVAVLAGCLASCRRAPEPAPPAAPAEQVTAASLADQAVEEVTVNRIRNVGGQVVAIRTRDGVSCAIFKAANGEQHAVRSTRLGEWSERHAEGESQPSEADCVALGQ